MSFGGNINDKDVNFVKKKLDDGVSFGGNVNIKDVNFVNILFSFCSESI